MKRHLKVLICLLLMNTCFAQGPLYRTQIDLPNRAIDNSHFQQALTQVLNKLTLDNEFAENPTISEALKHPRRYVKGYSLRKHQQAWQLLVRFQPQKLDGLIKQAQLSEWNGDRPNVLIWAVEDLNARPVFSNEDPKLATLLSQQAELLGIPITLPAMDLEDLSNLNSQDIINQNQQAIAKASKRYEGDTILTVYFHEDPEQQQVSDWQLNTADEEIQWQLIGEDKDQLIQRGLKLVKQKLAQSHAKSYEVVYINVNNIANPKAFDYLNQYLGHIKGVQQVEIDSVTPESVLYKLEVRNKLSAIIKSLAMNNHLTRINGTDGEDNTFYYRFN